LSDRLRFPSRLLAAALLILLLTAVRLAAAPSDEAQGYMHYDRGQRSFSNARWKEAAQELEQAVKLNPKLRDAWFLLGIARYQIGDYEKSEKALQEAVSIDARFYNGWMNLANTALARGDYDKAREY